MNVLGELPVTVQCDQQPPKKLVIVKGNGPSLIGRD